MILAFIPSWVFVFAAVFANGAATIFLRALARAGGGFSAHFPFLSAMQAGFGAAALFFYMIAFLLYALVLQRLPVSWAYLVITSLTQVLLISYGFLFLQERLTPLAWGGVGMTLAGLALVFSQSLR